MAGACRKTHLRILYIAQQPSTTYIMPTTHFLFDILCFLFVSEISSSHTLLSSDKMSSIYSGNTTPAHTLTSSDHVMSTMAHLISLTSEALRLDFSSSPATNTSALSNVMSTSATGFPSSTVKSTAVLSTAVLTPSPTTVDYDSASQLSKTSKTNEWSSNSMMTYFKTVMSTSSAAVNAKIPSTARSSGLEHLATHSASPHTVSIPYSVEESSSNVSMKESPDITPTYTSLWMEMTSSPLPLSTNMLSSMTRDFLNNQNTTTWIASSMSEMFTSHSSIYEYSRSTSIPSDTTQFAKNSASPTSVSTSISISVSEFGHSASLPDAYFSTVNETSTVPSLAITPSERAFHQMFSSFRTQSTIIVTSYSSIYKTPPIASLPLTVTETVVRLSSSLITLQTSLSPAAFPTLTNISISESVGLNETATPENPSITTTRTVSQTKDTSTASFPINSTTVPSTRIVPSSSIQQIYTTDFSMISNHSTFISTLPIQQSRISTAINSSLAMIAPPSSQQNLSLSLTKVVGSTISANMTLSLTSVYSSNALNTSTKLFYTSRTSSLVDNVSSSMNSSTVPFTTIVPSSSIQPLPTTQSSMFVKHSTFTSTLPIPLSRISTAINSSLAMITPSSSQQNLSLFSTSLNVVGSTISVNMTLSSKSVYSSNVSNTSTKLVYIARTSSLVDNVTSSMNSSTVLSTKIVSSSNIQLTQSSLFANHTTVTSTLPIQLSRISTAINSSLAMIAPSSSQQNLSLSSTSMNVVASTISANMTLSLTSVYSSNVLNTSTKLIYIPRTSSLVVNVTSSTNSSTVPSTTIVPSSSIQPLPTTQSSMFANHSTLTSTLPIQLSRISTAINSSLAMIAPSSSQQNLSLFSTSSNVVGSTISANMTLASKSVYSTKLSNTSTTLVYIARTSSLVVNVTSSTNSSTVPFTKIVPLSSIQPLPTTQSSMFANHSTFTSTLPIYLSRISTSTNSSLANIIYSQTAFNNIMANKANWLMRMTYNAFLVVIFYVFSLFQKFPAVTLYCQVTRRVQYIRETQQAPHLL